MPLPQNFQPAAASAVTEKVSARPIYKRGENSSLGMGPTHLVCNCNRVMSLIKLKQWWIKNAENDGQGNVKIN